MNWLPRTVMRYTDASLARGVVLRLALGFSVLVLLLSWLAYERRVAELQDTAAAEIRVLAAAGASESGLLFGAAQRNTELVRDEYLRRLQATPPERSATPFQSWFARSPDGLVRVRPERDNHKVQPSLYLRDGLTLTDDLVHRTWVAFDLLRQWGPPMTQQAFATYIDLPGEGLVMHAPSVNWGALATPDTNNFDYPPVAGASPQRNPQRRNQWTPVYFDDKAGIYMVSTVTPVDQEGRWIAAVSQDISIESLLQRALVGSFPGVFTVIFSRDGKLITHPEFIERIRAGQGSLDVAGLNTPLLDELVALQVPSDTSVLVKQSRSGDYQLAATNIAGPDWVYVTLLPNQILKEQALRSAGLILVGGLAVLLALVLLTRWVVGVRIGQPVQRLREATVRIRQGQSDTGLDTLQRPDELGELGSAFVVMGRELHERETSLRDTTQQLSEQLLRLQHSERFIRAIANGLPGLVAYWGADQRCAFANIAYENWFGFKPSQMVGMHVRDFKSSNGLYEKDRPYMEAALRGEPQGFERSLRNARSGEFSEFWVQYIPDTSDGVVRGYFALCSDISAIKQAQHEQQRVSLLLEASQSMARVGGWEVDLRTRKVFWTPQVYALLEVSPEDYHPSIDSTQRFFTPRSHQRARELISLAEDSAEVHDQEFEMVTGLGRLIWVHSRGMVTREGDRVVRRFSVIQDVTERRQAESALRDSETRWKLALDSTGDGVWDTNLKTGVETLSRRMCEMYGYEPHELQSGTGNGLDDITHPDDIERMLRDRNAHLRGDTPTYINEHRVRCRDGTWKWILSRGMVIERDAWGEPLRMLGTHTDITERKQSEALIWQQANFDSLTGLPNRSMLRDRLEQDLRKCRRSGHKIAILFIDLDHFKEVNDTLGHDSGDLLLVEAAYRIRACVRESDTVARMGGDEFTVVLPDLSDSQPAEMVAGNIIRSVGEGYQIDGERAFVSASVGLTMFPDDGAEIDDLLKHADQALYAAKAAGRNRMSHFTPELQEAANQRMRLAQDLRVALKRDEFRIVYQPIIELATGRIAKAEALLRWHHPSRGVVSPAVFIPIAESTGLIVEIGEWVLQQAAHQVRTWRTDFAPDFQISVNKSPVQFHSDAGQQARWFELLTTLGLPGQCVVLEITEGLLLDANTAVIDQLLALRDAGVGVSLDDFGTGYSSLSYLQRYDIDYIKIDQSFVRNLTAGSRDLPLCKAMIVMAHELGMRVIAEGVETEVQRQLLLEAGCDMAQGYLFSRPIDAQAFEAMMRERA